MIQYMKINLDPNLFELSQTSFISAALDKQIDLQNAVSVDV